MSTPAIPLPLRAARMSVLGRTLRERGADYPLIVAFPGDAEHAATERTFDSREAVERTLTDAQVNAINEGLAIYTLPDGGFLLAAKNAADPWNAEAWPRPWIGAGRNWLRRV